MSIWNKARPAAVVATIAAAIAIVLAGCVAPPKHKADTRESESPAQAADRGVKAVNPVVRAPNKPLRGKQDKLNERQVEKALRAHLRRWRGTPYRYGGSDRSGIDCSGYVNRVYKDVFGKALPRTTALLAKQGSGVRGSTFIAGDLLLFKTGPRQSHVGVYIGDGEFMHASTSRGVIASKINNRYWARAFRGARRLDN